MADQLKCPKCAEAVMAAVLVKDVEVDRCPGCGGLWFDADELNELLEHDAKELEKLMDGEDSDGLDENPGVCPRDGDEMLRVCSARDREVVVDLCMMCNGIWLDGGEFRRLAGK